MLPVAYLLCHLGTKTIYYGNKKLKRKWSRLCINEP